MAPNRDEVYRDSNFAAIEYAKNAIQFAFLLNGAAATALFAKAGKDFVFSASLLAIGAALATVCMGVSYIVQLLVAETWRQESNGINFIAAGKWRNISIFAVEWIRVVALLFWVSSMVFFFCGIYSASQVNA